MYFKIIFSTMKSQGGWCQYMSLSDCIWWTLLSDRMIWGRQSQVAGPTLFKCLSTQLKCYDAKWSFIHYHKPTINLTWHFGAPQVQNTRWDQGITTSLPDSTKQNTPHPAWCQTHSWSSWQASCQNAMDTMRTLIHTFKCFSYMYDDNLNPFYLSPVQMGGRGSGRFPHTS